MPEAHPTTTVVLDIAELRNHVGEALGSSAWHDVTQEDVSTFASLTGDEQWIHVDPERAVSGPFGGTVAHGYFTLALSTRFLDQVVRITGASVVLNYGSNRVRYPAPVPVGSRLRAHLEIAAVEEVTGGTQVVYRLTYEIDGGTKPVCVAEIVFRYYRDLPAGRGR